MTAPTQQPAPLSHIYAPSTATVPSTPDTSSKHSRPVRMLMCAAAALGATCAGFAVVHRDVAARWMGGVGFTACALAAFLGAASGAGAWFRSSSRPKGAGAIFINAAAFLGNLAMLAIGAAGALLSTFGFSRGRQLRRFGRVMLPRVIGGRAWSHTKVSVVSPTAIPAGLAAQWRETVAPSTLRSPHSRDSPSNLVALGAPPHIISASQADAIDEVRHAELCFSLARSLDAREEDPGPFPAAQRARTLPPTRTLGLAVLAVDSLVDGALHEGVSARVIAKLAKKSDVPAIRGVLEIAADEGRHSAHGWDVVDGLSPRARVPWRARCSAPFARSPHGCALRSPQPRGTAPGNHGVSTATPSPSTNTAKPAPRSSNASSA